MCNDGFNIVFKHATRPRKISQNTVCQSQEQTVLYFDFVVTLLVDDL